METENQGPLVNTLVWVFTALATIFVTFRLISRIKIKPNAGWDDLAITVALAMDIVYSIVISIAVSKGTGAHAATLPSPEAAVQAGYWNVVAVEVGIFSFGLPKVAIALLLGRILNIRPALCWILYALAGILTVYAIVQDIVFIEQCSPVEGAWNRSIDAKCWNPWPIAISGIVYSVLSALLDLFYAVLPIAIISSLNMDTRRKVGLGIMMGLGVVAGIIGFYKCSKLPALASPKTDFTWATAPVIYWSSIEANCVIIAACVPTISPIMSLFVTKTKSLVSSSPYSNGPRPSSYARDGHNRPLQSSGVFGGSRANEDNTGGSQARLTTVSSGCRIKRTPDGWLELDKVENGTSEPIKSPLKAHPATELTYIGEAK